MRPCGQEVAVVLDGGQRCVVVVPDGLEREEAFQTFLLAMLGDPSSPQLRARVAGARLCTLGAGPPKRHFGATRLGLQTMGALFSVVAARIDARVMTARLPIHEPDPHDELARWFGKGAVFLRWCADVCQVAYGLDDDGHLVLWSRLRAGSVKEAANVAGKAHRTVANISTAVFAKLGITGFHELPVAIGRAARIVRVRGREHGECQLVLAFAEGASG